MSKVVNEVLIKKAYIRVVSDKVRGMNDVGSTYKVSERDKEETARHVIAY